MVSVYKHRMNIEKETKEHWCPNCENWYVPKYNTKEEAPKGTIYREQYITGICSNLCWDEFLGAES